MGTAAWQSAAVALAIGLLIGSERERSSQGGSPAGVRTFGLAALAGCLAALVHPAVLAAVVVGVAAYMAVGYARSSVDDLGATTEVALVLTVLLGGLAASAAALAAGAGVATAVVLVSKDRMHRFVREKITDVEVADALKFFVVAFIVLPLVPHASLGPYGVIDPRRIWTLVVAVTALGWLGYVAVRMLGPRRGLPAAGLAGGFISGAATTGAMARIARSPELYRPALAGALLASVATLVQLVIVTAVADGRVAATLAPAAALGAAVLAAEAAWLTLRRRPERIASEQSTQGPAAPGPASSGLAASGPAAPALAARESGDREVGGLELDTHSPNTPQSDALDSDAVRTDGRGFDALDSDAPRRPNGDPATPGLAGRRPFALIPALLLAAILTVLLVVAALANDALGRSGAILAVSLAGLADAHAGALTAATLSFGGSLTVQTAALAAMAAVGVNTIVKLALALAAGGRQVCAALAALYASPIAAVALGLALSVGVTG